MAHPKKTGKKVASKASKQLSGSQSKKTRSVAGSALSQKHGKGHNKSGKK